MKRAAAVLLLLVAGCSTAPLADLMDFFWPGAIGPEKAPPTGGVCTPRPLIPPPPSPPGAPALPAIPIGPPVPPPASPVPGPAVPPSGPAVPPPPAPVGGF